MNLEHKVEGEKCDLRDGQCILIKDNQTFTVSVTPSPIQIEEQSNINISIPNEWRLDSAWIEGMNMFMGRMLIIQESTTSHDVETEILGSFFLGSCSQPKMTWKIMLKLYKGDEEQPLFLEYHFTTSV